MTVTALQVKTLREKTGAGMLDCKKALQESRGDIEKAIEFLRKRGLSMAASKLTRVAAEGLLGASFKESKDSMGALVEVNCETDFVAKTDEFQNFVNEATRKVLEQNPKDLEALMETHLVNGSKIRDSLMALVAKIGENILVRRFVRWEAKEKEKFGFYLHAGSKIGVMVRIADPEAKLEEDATKDLAMHVAAMHPQYVRREEVPPDVIQKEKEIQAAGLVNSKKPPEIQEKIIEGKLARWYSDVCLEDQIFVKDLEGKKTVREWLKGSNARVKILEFVRMQVGESLGK